MTTSFCKDRLLKKFELTSLLRTYIYGRSPIPKITTLLNDFPLLPGKMYILDHGDEISLGAIKFIIKRNEKGRMELPGLAAATVPCQGAE